MKKVAIVSLLVVISFLISCNSKIDNSEKGVEKFLKDLKTYNAEMIVTFTNNKKTTTMKMKQTYDMNGKYEITLMEPESLKGYQTVWDGEKIEEYNPITDKKVQAKPNPVKNQVLFGTFLHNYLQEDNVSLPIVTEGDQLVIEVVIPGNYKYMAKEKVWFNKKDNIPNKVEIYDKEGNLTIQIEIIAFQYNK